MPRSSEPRRFLLFLAVGLLNTVVGYCLFALIGLTGAGVTAAVVGSTVLSVLFNFQSIGRIVFGGGSASRLPRFVAVYAGQCAINLVALHLLAGAGIAPLAAEAIVLPPLAVLTFVAMRRFVFAR